MATKIGGGGRKIGRNLKKCAAYKASGRRKDNQFKKHIKFLKNRERWAADVNYQKRQTARTIRLAPKEVRNEGTLASVMGS